jgi:hypothetical protein
MRVRASLTRTWTPVSANRWKTSRLAAQQEGRRGILIAGKTISLDSELILQIHHHSRE